MLNYKHCDRPSQFFFSNNQVIMSAESKDNGFHGSLTIKCSNVQVLITDSYFENKGERFLGELSIVFNALTNNSLLLNNNTFKGVVISGNMCNEFIDDMTCIEDNLSCPDTIRL